MENLPQYDKGGVMTDTKLTLYWNEATNTWGPPNDKHYWIHDVEWTTATSQVAKTPIVPNADYNKRYAVFNRNDLCNTDWPVSIEGTTLNCIIRSLVDTHLSATFGFGFDHIRGKPKFMARTIFFHFQGVHHRSPFRNRVNI